MSVDFVAAKLADLPTNHPTAVGGCLAWLTDEKRLAVLSETGGDWLPLLSSGAIFSDLGSYSDLANGASVDITRTFPAGLFTQPPVVVADPFSTRINVGIKSVTKDQVVIRLSNFSGVGMADGTKQLQIHAIQLF